jgi:hypothetical protein
MMDLEGIVSKRIGSRYVSGRTRAWLTLLHGQMHHNKDREHFIR